MIRDEQACPIRCHIDTTGIIANRDRYQQIFEDILQNGRQAYNWQISDIKLVARALIQMCAGVSRWYRPEGGFSIEQIADQYYALLTRGLHPRS